MDFKSILLTPIKPEHRNVSAAKESIAANETLDSSDYFRRRINSLPAVGSDKQTAQCRLRPAKSIGVIHEIDLVGLV